MFSWNALDPLRFTPAGAITAAFLDIAKVDLREAAQYVSSLPYGRNSDPEDPLIVLVEQRGTCSTKHALLRRLALEQRFGIVLVLGIYEMTERNTPGIGPVLLRHGLTRLPEAHCYLRSANQRVDITKASSDGQADPIERFLYEEEIAPEQVTHHKTRLHKKFLQEWITGNNHLSGLSLQQVWAIREECIAALSQ